MNPYQPSCKNIKDLIEAYTHLVDNIDEVLSMNAVMDTLEHFEKLATECTNVYVVLMEQRLPKIPHLKFEYEWRKEFAKKWGHLYVDMPVGDVVWSKRKNTNPNTSHVEEQVLCTREGKVLLNIENGDAWDFEMGVAPVTCYGKPISSQELEQWTYLVNLKGEQVGGRYKSFMKSSGEGTFVMSNEKRNSNSFGWESEYWILDKNGKPLHSGPLDEVGKYSDGKWVVKIGERYTYIDVLKGPLFDISGEEVRPAKGGFCAVRIEGNLWHRINRNNEVIIGEYQNVLLGEKFHLLKESTQNWKIYDVDTLQETPFLPGVEILYITDDIVIGRKDIQCMYIKPDGTLLIDERCKQIFPFSDGVSRCVKEDRIYYINKQGRHLYEEGFISGEDFRNGFAVVEREKGKFNYLCPDGTFLLKDDVTDARSFTSDGCALVRGGSSTQKIYMNSQMRAIDVFGNPIFED